MIAAAMWGTLLHTPRLAHNAKMRTLYRGNLRSERARAKARYRANRARECAKARERYAAAPDKHRAARRAENMTAEQLERTRATNRRSYLKNRAKILKQLREKIK